MPASGLTFRRAGWHIDDPGVVLPLIPLLPRLGKNCQRSKNAVKGANRGFQDESDRSRRYYMLKSSLLRLALAMSLAAPACLRSWPRRQACQNLNWRRQKPASRLWLIIITITIATIAIATITVIIIAIITTIIIITITFITAITTIIIIIMEPIPGMLSVATAAEAAFKAEDTAAGTVAGTAAGSAAGTVVSTLAAITEPMVTPKRRWRVIAVMSRFRACHFPAKGGNLTRMSGESPTAFPRI